MTQYKLIFWNFSLFFASCNREPQRPRPLFPSTFSYFYFIPFYTPSTFQTQKHTQCGTSGNRTRDTSMTWEGIDNRAMRTIRIVTLNKRAAKLRNYEVHRR